MELTLDKCLSSLAACDGTLLSFYDGKIVTIVKSGILYSVQGKILFIRGASAISDTDRSVDIQARYHKDGSLEFNSFRYSNKFPYALKELISAAALILAAGMFFRDYRFHREKFCIFQERE